MLFLFDLNCFLLVMSFSPLIVQTNAATNICLSCRKRKRDEGGTILDIMAIHTVHHRISGLRPCLCAESRDERGNCLHGQPNCITSKNLFLNFIALPQSCNRMDVKYMYVC